MLRRIEGSLLLLVGFDMSGMYPRSNLFKGRKRQRSVGTSTALVPVTPKQADQNQARTIQRLVKLTRGIAPERKFVVATGSFANVADTAGSQISLIQVGQGSQVNQRTGDAIRLKSLQLQVRVASGTGSIGTAPTNEEFTRFILVQDKQTVADGTATAATIVASTSTPQLPLPNTEVISRFKWLWVSPLFHHARIASSGLAAALTTPLTPSQSPVGVYKNFKMDIPIRYNNTAATDFQKNSLVLIVITNLAADTLDADWNCRFEFIDD